MAISGLSSLEREPIFCKDDPCYKAGRSPEENIEDGATVFWGRNIPSGVQAHISDMQTSQQLNLADGGTQTLVNRKSKKNREAFRWGIAGWDKFANADGAIKYETENVMFEGRSYPVVAEATLNLIPLALINEIGEEIFNRNTLTEPQRKKLEQLSSLFEGSNTSTAGSATKDSEQSEDADETQIGSGTGGTEGSPTKT